MTDTGFMVIVMVMAAVLPCAIIWVLTRGSEMSADIVGLIVAFFIIKSLGVE